MLTVIGAGAAGVFAAITAKKNSPDIRVILIEKGEKPLAKVLLSGGGRCNITNGCFDPILLSKNYPRGEKELIGPFTHFQPQDTIDWFEERGVRLKQEADGRIFPSSDKAETVVNCLLSEVKKLGIEVHLKANIDNISKQNDIFTIHLDDSQKILSNKLILATGSSPDGYGLAKAFGHTIVEPIPSLFAFNLAGSPFKELSGISINNVQVCLKEASICQKGAILFTHYGISGPAIIKLSSFGARFLHEKGYKTELSIEWRPEKDTSKFPKRFLKFLSGNPPNTYLIDGKTKNRAEFVTCGGISLKEVDFKTMQSKIVKGLFFAGEILDIDGITGGFNLQNAWTTAFIAGSYTQLSSKIGISACAKDPGVVIAQPRGFGAAEIPIFELNWV